MWPRYLLSLLLLSFPIPQPRYWIHLAYCEVFGQECSEGSFPNSTERAHVTTYEADHHHPTLTPRASRVKGLGFTPGLWDSLTMRACTEALEPFRKAAATPSGLAMCYNLPFLDNSTGVFQSELRIFRVTDPSGLWIAINESSVRLGLSFPDATIQASTVPGFASTAPKNLVPLDDRAVALRKRREEASILHIFHFVGQLSKDVMERPMTLIMLRGYVAPQVTVGASTSGDIQISDLLSLADASFVSGELVRHEPLPFIYRNRFVYPVSYLAMLPTSLVLVLSWLAMGTVLASYRNYRCNLIRKEDLYKLSRGEDIELETLQGL